jgi:hypothetical protein
LKKNPSKLGDIKLARKLLLNMARKSHPVNEASIESTWNKIEKTVQEMDRDTLERKVIPLNALGTIKKYEKEYRNYSKYHQFYRMTGILLFAFALAITANILQPQEPMQIVETPVIYEVHYAPPGVKSNLTLQDGSKVILNSGSSLRYIKNFEEHQRELELIGEAYFEVSKDSLRPFKVRTGAITTKALGTSFNIKAHLLPEEIASFTAAGVYDDDDNQHLSFIQGAGHGGSHPHHVHEFLSALHEGRDPYPNAKQSANITCVGILAHESAMNGGEKIQLPDFTFNK